VRTVFALYLLVGVVGAACFIAVGLAQR